MNRVIARRRIRLTRKPGLDFTGRGKRPIWLQKAAPFAISSAFVFSACTNATGSRGRNVTSNEDNGMERPHRDIYKKHYVINRLV